jgi:hypothetical protein
VTLSNHYAPTIDIAQYALHQGNARSANLIEGFIPLYPRGFQHLLFTDIRFYNPNSTPIEGNIDLGFRRLYHQGNRLFGLYAGYDRYRSETRRYYSQGNAGIEFWFNRFFIGGNGYVPVGTKVYDNDALNLAYLTSTGSSFRYNIAYEQGKERAMPGADAEIGYDVTSSFTLYGGGYYFDHSDAKSIIGPKLRATYTIYRSNTHRLLKLFDRIRLEGLVSHDSVRGTSWMAGLRFTFGLVSNRSNPTTGVARHMVDPIRRDLNVISEAFNTSPQPYTVDGQKVLVDVVSNTSGRTIDDAVTGEADIISVSGTHTANDVLTVGDRELTITGGRTMFSVGGHVYTLGSFGQRGRLTSADNVDLFQVDGTSNITLEHLTLLSSTDDGLAVNNQGSSFGHVTINDVFSNVPFAFPLASSETGASGKVTFTNNTLELASDSTAFNSDIATEFVGVGFAIQDTSGSQLLIVDNFFGNKIEILNRTATIGTGDTYAVCVQGQEGSSVIFANGMFSNEVTINNTTGTSIVDGYALYTGNVMFSAGVTQNEFTSSTNDNDGYAWGVNDPILVIGNVSNNVFDASDNSDDGYGWNIQGISNTDTVIRGNVSYNDFTASNNTGGSGYALAMRDNITITGNLNNNTFTTSNNDNVGWGFYISTDTIMIQGNINNNIAISMHRKFKVFTFTGQTHFTCG